MRRWKREDGKWNSLFYRPFFILYLRAQILANICVLCLVSLLGCSSPAAADRVCFKRNCFDVEVVITAEERQKGLMDREALDPETGMLFIFPREDIYPFWMKNTLIALDMIWLDRGRKVVHIEKGAKPCVSDPCPQYMPPAEALYVVEFNAGTADNYIIQIGDQAEIHLVE